MGATEDSAALAMGLLLVLAIPFGLAAIIIGAALFWGIVFYVVGVIRLGVYLLKRLMGRESAQLNKAGLSLLIGLCMGIPTAAILFIPYALFLR